MSDTLNGQSRLAHHFVDLQQQKSAATLGMWLFLATEVLFFGGLFVAYTLYKLKYYEAFVAGSHELSITLGCVNTAILITSSLTMALGVYGAQTGRKAFACNSLLATLALAGAFLVVKYFEWSAKFEHHLVPGPDFQFDVTHAAAVVANPELLRIEHVKMFFILYYIMTGLHGIHVVAGIGVIAWLYTQARKGVYSAEYYTPVELVGLYWHFVDIVWIFLFPLLYLLGRH
ncbi:MAG: cytochrome c oxidase subunit 3 [Candidatus Sumerlaeaceae bacterium]|nr:cytochrome c oxidase subunit 3 [Candidatus Sumerlaeaceae bacterium]